MPSFSSVVRKPGQKIQPKGPRRNVQRNPARHAVPPSSTPTSQTVSPAVEPVDRVPESEDLQPRADDEQELQTAPDRNAYPSIIPSIVTSVESARGALDASNSNVEGVATPVQPFTIEVSAPSFGLQILHPLDIVRKERSAGPDTIPIISTTTPSSTAQKRKATNEPTPAPSDDSVPERQTTEELRKRQKRTHAVEVVESSWSRTPPPSDTNPSVQRTTPRYRRSESRTSDVLLQDATTGAAAVSELALDIENRARSQRSRSDRRSDSQVAETEESAGEPSTQPGSKRTKNKRKSKSERLRELAQQVVDAAVGGGTNNEDAERRSRSRLSTPENAEELEIDPEQVAMFELTKDIKIGRKSDTEKRMHEDWAEIKERRKSEVEKRRDAARGKKNPVNGEREAEETAVPKQIVVNGVIVVANESREVAFGVGLEQAAREQADVAIEDDRIYKNVNQGTLGKKAGLRKRSQWDEDATNLFYQGLRMFGTDFTMVANLFPESVDRRIVKKKYLAELESDPERVDKCVTAKEAVSMEEYATMTNMEFEDPDNLMKELEEEEKRLRAEDAKRREDQGYVMNHEDADVPIPSTEIDDAGDPVAADGEEQDEDTATPAPTGRTQAPSTTRGERITALAEGVVQAAVTPKKKQTRKTRESTGPGRGGRGGRGGRKGKRAAEGIEERIGPLEVVPR